MSEMVERVAKALYDSGAIRSDEMLHHLARAAIEAMRPSEDFVWAAVHNIHPKLDCIRGHDLGGDEALAIFNAVIDAALGKT